MSQSPFEQAGSLCIGTVDFVSPDEIKVALDIEAPESVALNAGGPRPFPRVNSYLLIPVDDGYLVGQIEWITVERSAFPKRRGMQDFGLIDLPYPMRKLCLTPLGTLFMKTIKPGNEDEYSFRRGKDSFPSIGASVLLPTEKQLRSIIESGDHRRIKIGTSPLAGNANVCVDPDRLFVRHLAVLGNTGSGKSCSVAGLIRWSLEQATKANGTNRPNARFIVLDPNGEYSRAFGSQESATKAQIFKMDHGNGEFHLHVPLWFWNSAELCSFTQASIKAQKPLLIESLRNVRDGATEPPLNLNGEIRRYLRTIITTLQMEKNSGGPFKPFPASKGFFETIQKWNLDIEKDLQSLDGNEHSKLSELHEMIEALCVPRRAKYPTYTFTRIEVNELIECASRAHSAFGGSDSDTQPSDVDSPREFTGNALLRSVEATTEMFNFSVYSETLLIRIRSILANPRMKAIFGESSGMSLDQWLNEYLGNKHDQGCIKIIDLSLVPSEVIHICVAVIARMIFEALQRYRKLTLEALPTVLVMEEAHTFISRYKEDAENQDVASVCCQVFERIAREGRKYGLGLVISSQRPSELSPTVLSQCNSFLLHRISNDRDQDLVHRLVPDNLKGLLRELPSLPSQYAILLGWASELPVMVKMNDLPKSQQPHSDDPDFWNVWIGKDDERNLVERNADWKSVADDWQGKTRSDPPDGMS